VLRLFIFADRQNMTVTGGDCALEVDAIEQRIWPTYERMKAEAQAKARSKR